MELSDIIVSWTEARWWLLTLFLIVSTVTIWKKWRFLTARLGFLQKRMPYKKAHFLLTKIERHFFQALRQAIPAGVSIAPKVRLADVLWLNEYDWKAGWGNRAAQKHLDFVLINERNAYILLAIELDDSTHDRLDRHLRDLFVDKALETAGIGILRVAVRSEYDIGELKDRIESILPKVYR